MVMLMLWVSISAHAQLTSVPEVAHADIEYKTVAEALSVLQSKPGVEISRQRNWTIIVEPKVQVIWSFAPEGHPAYPSVVKRSIKDRNGKVYVDMAVKCDSTKEACDALVREFIKMSADTRAYMQAHDKAGNIE